MKKLLFSIVTMIFLTSDISSYSFAGQGNVHAHIERQTYFNSITDSIATLGKSKNDKERIKKKRRWARRTDRLKKVRTQQIR